MATEVTIPAMGESISSGILAAWHVKDGEHVQEGQSIFELETDKITSEATAEVAGIINILVEADEEVEIGQVVARIEPAAEGTAPTKPDTPAAAVTPAETEPAPVAPATESAPAPTPAPAAPATPGVNPQETLSPAARKAAAETGVDVSKISGTGKAGRVTKGDILQATENTPATAPQTPAATAPSAPASASERETRRKITPCDARSPTTWSTPPSNPPCSRPSTKST